MHHSSNPQTRFFSRAPPSSGRMKRFARISMMLGCLGAQWPMMRTEGSFTKAPAVVPRPVASISQRSIMRMGETVFVPTRCTLIRCGISEPVTKTVCSVTFSFRSGLPLTGVSASEALAAIRTVTPAAITLFTTQNTPAGTRRKWSKKAAPNTRRSNPSRVYPGFRGFRCNGVRTSSSDEYKQTGQWHRK